MFEKILNFLNELKVNNHREWFLENKSQYELLRKDFQELLEAIISKISGFDNRIEGVEAKNCMFRINRDIRFSQDKTPYKTHFGAFISNKGKKAVQIHGHASYYLHIEPSNRSICAGGAYTPNKYWLSNIRQAIDYDGNELQNIIGNIEFKHYFNCIEGEMLKSVPKGYDKNHKFIELLKHKSFLAVHRIDDVQLINMKNDTFVDYTSDIFKALYPFNQYFNNQLNI